MPRPYSQDLRDRVMASVAGGRSRRATAKIFSVSVATVVSGASAPSRLALDGSGCFGGPAPGQQFAETTVGPVIDELGQQVGQVSMRIDAMQFAGLDQRGEHGPVFCPFVAAREQSIFSVERNRAHASLDGIGVDLDEAVVEETQQPIPLIEAVANGLGDR